MRLSEKELIRIMRNSHAKIRNNDTSKTPHMESDISHESMGKKETPRFNGQVSIRIKSYRHRLCDPDGVSKKYLIDAIVSAGILADDSCKEINEKESSHEQIKIPKTEEEKTVIVIELI